MASDYWNGLHGLAGREQERMHEMMKAKMRAMQNQGYGGALQGPTTPTQPEEPKPNRTLLLLEDL